MSSADPPATASVAGAAPGGSPRRPPTVATMSARSPAALAARNGRTGRSLQRGGDRGAVHDDLARAQAAQRHLGRRLARRGPEPAEGQALGGGDQRDAVGDAETEHGEGGGAEWHQGSVRVAGVTDH